jgi:hypothetical protein
MQSPREVTFTLVFFLLLVGVSAAGRQSPAEKSWSFDAESAGQLPGEFSGEVGEWKTVADSTAPSQPNVLAQLAKNARPVFNVALVKNASYTDLELSVQLRAVAGEIDQGGGVVWRARDARNYYIARYNPLEDNFRVYKVVDGQRTQLQTADVPRTAGWRSLRMTMAGQKIECFLDGKKYLEAYDDTFPGAGRIGLWTKADAQTHFDNLTAREYTRAAAK